MKVEFFGCRGSIAVPGPSTVKYGGNTTCIGVQTDSGTELILDGGTGIRVLGEKRLDKSRNLYHVLITHTHWDHIQGIPFFAPLFVPGNVVRFYGPPDPVRMRSLRDTLLVQLEHAYFPVAETELSAQLEYVDLAPGESKTLGDAVVTPVLMNHPVTCLGYRIEADGCSMFFTGDHEPPYNIYEPHEPEFASYQDLLDERIGLLEDAIRGVDVLICDATYLESDYDEHKGWGHSSTDHCLDLAKRTGAGTLVLTHHEPNRDDDALDALEPKLLEGDDDRGFDLVIAREGMAIEVTGDTGEEI